MWLNQAYNQTLVHNLAIRNNNFTSKRIATAVIVHLLLHLRAPDFYTHHSSASDRDAVGNSLSSKPYYLSTVIRGVGV